jgi:tetratricopeptide (TPR) repeat protein
MDWALRIARKAVEIDPALSLAHARLAWIEGYVGEYDASIASFEKAIELSPNDGDPYAYYAHMHNYMGDPETSIELTKRALQFDPMLPPNIAFHWGDSLFQLRRYDEAIEKLSECVAKAPGFFVAHNFLNAAYSEIGREADARRELEILQELMPGERLRISIDRLPYRSDDVPTRLLEGLRKAGMTDA